MGSFNEADALQKIRDVISYAQKLGADAADAVYVESNSAGVSWRNGKLENLSHSEGGDLGLRVFFGHRQASAATSDHTAKSLKEIAERVVAMAKLATEDPFCGLAAPSDIAKDLPELELADAYDPDMTVFIAKAKEMEDAALSVEGVTQCEGAHAGGGEMSVALAATNGFSAAYKRTGYHLSTSVLVGSETEMEHDYEYDSAVFQCDLKSPASIGCKAAQNALKNLGARKMPTCQVPVVFDPRESNSILSSFLGAISGSSVARGTSYLKDKMGQRLFPSGVNIIDDPFRPRGLRSKVFDGEGIKPMRRNLVEDGVLQTWLLDLRSARQLGLVSTGHASRGTTGIPHPSPTNCYFEAGAMTPAELIKDIKSGFYVTELMGRGANGVTGDLSQAARGFWIENGEIAFPVFEMTIAGNMKDIFKNLSIASDLAFRYGIDASTIRVEGLTVAGV